MEISIDLLNTLRNSKQTRVQITTKIHPDIKKIMDEQVKILGVTKIYYLESLILAQYAGNSSNQKVNIKTREVKRYLKPGKLHGQGGPKVCLD